MPSLYSSRRIQSTMAGGSSPFHAPDLSGSRHQPRRRRQPSVGWSLLTWFAIRWLAITCLAAAVARPAVVAAQEPSTSPSPPPSAVASAPATASRPASVVGGQSAAEIRQLAAEYVVRFIAVAESEQRQALVTRDVATGEGPELNLLPGVKALDPSRRKLPADVLLQNLDPMVQRVDEAAAASDAVFHVVASSPTADAGRFVAGFEQVDIEQPKLFHGIVRLDLVGSSKGAEQQSKLNGRQANRRRARKLNVPAPRASANQR
ncbi:MAG: hypothetical protein ACKO38_06930 [Planctomycetota bacterium]